MDADQRRTVAKQWDYQHDPATEEEREEGFELFGEKEQIEEAIRNLESMREPTPLDRESKIRQLAELHEQLRDINARINAHTIGSAKKSRSVPSSKIIAFFKVDKIDNKRWWNRRMRDAKDYDLLKCRASRGRARTPSLWYPDCIANWLVTKKGKTIPPKVIAAVLRKHFPDCEEVAEHIETFDY